MAKPIAPKAPLWAFLAATQVPDLLSFAVKKFFSTSHEALSRLS
jgi:hypothetical protein